MFFHVFPCFSMFFHVFPCFSDTSLVKLVTLSLSFPYPFPILSSRAGGHLRDVAVKIQHPGVIDSAFMDLNIVPQRRTLGEIWAKSVRGSGRMGTPFPTDLGLKFFTKSVEMDVYPLVN